jgi:hypothetical protein
MTTRLCAICQRPEVFLIHGDRRIQSLNADGLCVRCSFAPEVGIETRLRQSIAFNDELKRIQEKTK